jgi:hypothetical protein
MATYLAQAAIKLHLNALAGGHGELAMETAQPGAGRGRAKKAGKNRPHGKTRKKIIMRG